MLTPCIKTFFPYFYVHIYFYTHTQNWRDCEIKNNRWHSEFPGFNAMNSMYSTLSSYQKWALKQCIYSNFILPSIAGHLGIRKCSICEAFAEEKIKRNFSQFIFIFAFWFALRCDTMYFVHDVKCKLYYQKRQMYVLCSAASFCFHSFARVVRSINKTHSIARNVMFGILTNDELKASKQREKDVEMRRENPLGNCDETNEMLAWCY